MKLYDLAGAEDDLRFSPNCRRIKMALEHKGLVAETVPWRFVEKDVIAFSGQKAVPVLVDGDKSVSDSWEIAKYLESAYSDRPTLFGGPAVEGLALFVKFWCEQTLNRTILKIILPDLFMCDGVITSSQNLTRLRNEATALRNRQEFQRSQLTELASTDFESWAKESYEIATKIAYRNGGWIGIPRAGNKDCTTVTAAPLLPAG